LAQKHSIRKGTKWNCVHSNLNKKIFHHTNVDHPNVRAYKNIFAVLDRRLIQR